MTSAWLVEQSLTVSTFSHQNARLMGGNGIQCIQCVRYLDSTEDTGQHVETYLVARRAFVWYQDYSSRSCISMPGPYHEFVSRDTGIDRWICSGVFFVASGVSSEQVQRCLSVLEGRHLLRMCL